MHEEGWYIFYFIFAGISMISSSVVTYKILQLGSFKANTTYLFLNLHVSLLIEGVSSLPVIYVPNTTICNMMGFLHFYSGLANILVMICLTLVYVNFLIYNNNRLNEAIKYFSSYVIFILPLITILPMSTNSYGVSIDQWCTLPSGDYTANIWSMVIFYLWVWAGLLFSAIVCIWATVYAYRHDLEIARKLFFSIGLYVIITLVCWLPRSVPRFLHIFIDFESSTLLYLLTNLPLYISGLLYSIFFYFDRTMLTRYENQSGENVEANLQFTWEDIELALTKRLSEAE